MRVDCSDRKVAERPSTKRHSCYIPSHNGCLFEAHPDCHPRLRRRPRWRKGEAGRGVLSRTRSDSPVFRQSGAKVAVLGAAGGIGQPLSLLMKLNPHVSELSLYDVVNTPGVAADLSHINSRARPVCSEPTWVMTLALLLNHLYCYASTLGQGLQGPGAARGGRCQLRPHPDPRWSSAQAGHDP